MDLEGVTYLMQQAVDAGLQNVRAQADATGQQKNALVEQQKKKAEEALQASLSQGFWSSISKALSWVAQTIGVALAIAAAVITAAPVAIVVAAALALDKVLDQTGAYEAMGPWGKALSGLLKTASAADNWVHLGFEAANQLLDKTGAFDAIAKDSGLGAALSRALLSAGALVGSLAGTATFTVGAADAATLKTVAQVAGGVSKVVSGAADAIVAGKRFEVENLRLDGKEVRLQAEKLGKTLRDLTETITDELGRRSRVVGFAGDVAEASHEVRMAIAVLRG